MIHLKLFWGFFQVGLFGFGGGSALYPLIEDQCLNNSWLDGQAARVAELFAVTNAVPGVTAVKMAAYVGWSEGGFLGASAAVVGLSTPGLILLFGLYGALANLQTNESVSPTIRRLVEGLIRGLQFGAAGFIAYSLIRVFPGGIDAVRFTGGALLSLAVAVLLYFNFPPIPLILLCALIGALVF